MYLLVNNKEVIIYISTEAVLKSDGIHVGSNQVFSDKTLQIKLVDNVPAGIVPQKYCYNISGGFYLNENYKPVNATDPTMSEKVNYILNKIDPIIDEDRLSLEDLKAYYVSKANTECDKMIDEGTDVQLSDGVEHFSLTLKDQKNIDKLVDKVKMGMEMLPYHSDSNLCKLYPSTDIIRISLAADMHIMYYTTYSNSINTWIRRCETAEEVKQIYFGSELPGDIKTNFDQLIAVGLEEMNRLKEQYGL